MDMTIEVQVQECPDLNKLPMNNQNVAPQQILYIASLCVRAPMCPLPLLNTFLSGDLPQTP